MTILREGYAMNVDGEYLEEGKERRKCKRVQGKLE